MSLLRKMWTSNHTQITSALHSLLPAILDGSERTAYVAHVCILFKPRKPCMRCTHGRAHTHVRTHMHTYMHMRVHNVYWCGGLCSWPDWHPYHHYIKLGMAHMCTALWQIYPFVQPRCLFSGWRILQHTPFGGIGWKSGCLGGQRVRVKPVCLLAVKLLWVLWFWPMLVCITQPSTLVSSANRSTYPP